MNYLILALVSMVGYGLYSILLKVSLGHVSLGVALITVGAFLAAGGGLMVVNSGTPIQSQWSWGWPTVMLLLAAIVGTLSIVSFYAALANGPASVVVPIFAMNLTVASTLGILALGEPANLPRLLGILMAAGAVILVTRQ